MKLTLPAAGDIFTHYGKNLIIDKVFDTKMVVRSDSGRDTFDWSTPYELYLKNFIIWSTTGFKKR